MRTISWLGPALLVVAAVRLHGLSAAALPDYDSVRNWQIVREVAAGNLSNLFHHGSPGFSLLYAPVAWFTTSFHVFQYLNALVAVAAVGWLAVFIRREAALPALEAGLLTVLMGTSVFLTFSGRDFTMSSWSLLAFTGLLQAYYQRLRAPSQAALLRSVAWVAAGLSINYKFLLILPILAVFELWQRDGQLWQRGSWWRVGLILLLPYVVLGAVGVAGGLPWHRWPAVYYNIINPGAANPAGRIDKVQLDLLYYPRFLWDFESPLVLATLVAVPLLWRRELLGNLRRINLVRYLAGWAYAFLAGMSLLLKAPRGLLLVYALFWVLAFLSVRRLVPGRGLLIVVLGAILLNVIRVQREIYAYTPSSYPRVATWLREQGATGVVSTVGQGAAPFLEPGTRLAVVLDERQLPALARQGYDYVLLDNYWHVTNVARFDSLRREPPLKVWPEPMLTSPLLYLEHSEFTGLSYRATLSRQRAASRDPFQLQLYRLPRTR
ncbi:hypothetical protein LJY25_11235 [Hymenobacter sp. BT175]|uniref:hypothetical protein n=1 Tax=Hymenobacter translucens TaxID=2886507 RepID=UPI001D0E16BA|nr:hypothetical protein [Hymenobacter translucens]MCC2547021.1 hypothetical protein [Hymenobacter translucens]